MFELLKSKLKGINAINVTPFDEHLEIDWVSLKANIDFLLERRIEAVYPCGNTGEFYALTLQEAKQVTRFVTETVDRRCAVIAGVGYDARTACELAVHAEKAGADGIMVHQPVHPYLLSQGVVDYYKQIAASTSLPMVLYIRSEQITHETIAEAAAIPNVIAVKYAINHPPSFSRAVQEIKEDIVWICGTAEMWAPTFYAAGAEGFTSGMVNVDTERSFAMLEALKRRDYKQAMEVWKDILPFEQLREANRNGNNVSVVKEAMHQLGRIATNSVRPPISVLTSREMAEVAAMIQAWGLQKHA